MSKDNGINYRIDLSYLNTGSFRQLVTHDRIFLAPSLSWQLTPDTKLSVAYEFLNEKQVYDYGIPAFGNQLADIPITRAFTNPGVHNRQTNPLIDFRIDHRYNDKIRFNLEAVAAQNSKDWEATFIPDESPKSLIQPIRTEISAMLIAFIGLAPKRSKH